MYGQRQLLLKATRHYQKLRHPQTFPQTVQLTDGSTIQIRAISPKRPFLTLPIDSMTHPSWIGEKAKRMAGALSDERGQMARFNARFGGMDQALALGAQSISGLGGSALVTDTPDSGKPDDKARGKKTGKKK